MAIAASASFRRRALEESVVESFRTASRASTDPEQQAREYIHTLETHELSKLQYDPRMDSLNASFKAICITKIKSCCTRIWCCTHSRCCERRTYYVANFRANSVRLTRNRRRPPPAGENQLTNMVFFLRLHQQYGERLPDVFARVMRDLQHSGTAEQVEFWRQWFPGSDQPLNEEMEEIFLARAQASPAQFSVIPTDDVGARPRISTASTPVVSPTPIRHSSSSQLPEASASAAGDARPRMASLPDPMRPRSTIDTLEGQVVGDSGVSKGRIRMTSLPNPVATSPQSCFANPSFLGPPLAVASSLTVSTGSSGADSLLEYLDGTGGEVRKKTTTPAERPKGAGSSSISEKEEYGTPPSSPEKPSPGEPKAVGATTTTTKPDDFDD